jgi:hypothetical protein
MARLLAPLIAALLLGAAAPAPASAASVGCGYVDVPGGRAWKIIATRITCKPARRVARSCLMGTVPTGWTVRYRPSNDRTTMRSGRRVVSFQLVGGGGCIPVRLQRPTLRLRPSTISPGGSVTFTGSGWPANRRVDLLIGPPFSEADKFTSARTGARGRFRTTFRFPAAIEPGRYVVLACRRSCRVKVSASLRVTG